jgi:hypothetical protein
MKRTKSQSGDIVENIALVINTRRMRRRSSLSSSDTTTQKDLPNKYELRPRKTLKFSETTITDSESSSSKEEKSSESKSLQKKKTEEHSEQNTTRDESGFVSEGSDDNHINYRLTQHPLSSEKEKEDSHVDSTRTQKPLTVFLRLRDRKK